MISDAINNLLVRALAAVKREEGQTFVEYTLIAVVVAVALVGAFGIFKTDIGNALTSIEGAF